MMEYNERRASVLGLPSCTIGRKRKRGWETVLPPVSQRPGLGNGVVLDRIVEVDDQQQHATSDLGKISRWKEARGVQFVNGQIW